MSLEVVPLDELKSRIGAEIGTSDWVQIDQDRIDAFADVTNDHQFIHVDPEAAKQTPFGGTIAHGYLTLSLLPHFMSQATLLPEGLVMAMNYGSDKVRFLAPVKVGSRVRGRVTLLDVKEKASGQMLIKNEVTVEIEGEDKPALIAEVLSLFFLG
ncbi:MAG: MaoC family dehydratase [Actinobacteria bacterium]|nr:MaoC family dehydratase [Actinomycetota bacterium]